MDDDRKMVYKLYPKHLYRDPAPSKRHERDDYYGDTSVRIRCRCCGISWIDVHFFSLHLARSKQCCFYYWRLKRIECGGKELIGAGLHFDGSNSNKKNRGLVGVKRDGTMTLIPMSKRDADKYIKDTNGRRYERRYKYAQTNS